jgi:tRNA pseudouridine13 synthase
MNMRLLRRHCSPVRAILSRMDDLPRIADGLERLRARPPAAPAGFRVDEIAAYPPSGAGDHCFVRFEKTGLTTPDAVRALARALDADPRAAGTAGLKDRHAVTTQWASFERVDPARALALGDAVPGVRVLEAARHPHKLRTGHARGNRFALRLPGAAPEDGARAQAILARLARSGLPNYFGPQRFGADGRNAERARRWLCDGGPAPRARFERRLLVSALQSALFNAVAAERVRDGLLDRALRGDLLRKEDTGGIFTTVDLAAAARRVAAWEVSATGPMFGPDMRWPLEDALAREERALAAAGLERARLERFGRLGQGARRALRVRPAAVDLRESDGALDLAFELPAGSYATVLLAELLGPLTD